MSGSVCNHEDANHGRDRVLGDIAEAAAMAARAQGITEESAASLAGEAIVRAMPEIVRITVESLHRSKADLLAGLAKDRLELENQVQTDYSAAFANYEAAYCFFESLACTEKRPLGSPRTRRAGRVEPRHAAPTEAARPTCDLTRPPRPPPQTYARAPAPLTPDGACAAQRRVTILLSATTRR